MGRRPHAQPIVQPALPPRPTGVPVNQVPRVTPTPIQRMQFMGRPRTFTGNFGR